MSAPTVANVRSRYDDWVRMLRYPIYTQVAALFEHRAIWWSLQQIWHDARTELPASMLFDFIASSYATTQAVGVRRLLDRNKRTNSLGGLLEQMDEHNEVLTRVEFVSRSLWITPGAADSDFDRFAGVGAVVVNRNRISSDIVRLRATSQTVRTYVDKVIAHTDAIPPDALPSFNELHAAIDAIGEVFLTWHEFLCGVSVANLIPHPIGDWLAPLRVPWLRPGQFEPRLTEQLQRPPSLRSPPSGARSE